MRQGEAFGLSPGDLDGEELRVERQVIKTSKGLAFSPPKGNKTRVAPCPEELAEAVEAHMKQFPPVEVTLPWVDPDRPNLPWEDRPLVTVVLICTTSRGSAINRSTFDVRREAVEADAATGALHHAARGRVPCHAAHLREHRAGRW